MQVSITFVLTYLSKLKYTVTSGNDKVLHYSPIGAIFTLLRRKEKYKKDKKEKEEDAPSHFQLLLMCTAAQPCALLRNA